MRNPLNTSTLIRCGLLLYQLGPAGTLTCDSVLLAGKAALKCPANAAEQPAQTQTLAYLALVPAGTEESQCMKLPLVTL